MSHSPKLDPTLQGRFAPVIPEEHRQGMVDAYLGGLSQQAAAAQFGYSQWACRQELIDRGIPIRGHGLDKEAEAEFIRLYREGVPGPEAMRRVGGVEGSAYYYLRRNGVEPKSASECKRVYSLNETFFARVTTPEQAWLLGLLSADGCVHKKAESGTYSVTLGVARKDREVLETMRRLLEYDAPICDFVALASSNPRFPVGERLCSNLSVRSNQLATDLIALGVTERKSLTLQPWAGPEYLLPSYFRGLVDGDGHVGFYDNPSGKRIWAIGLAGSHAVVSAFRDFADKHTGSARNPVAAGKIWAIAYNGTRAPQRLATVLYKDATVYLERKKRAADEMMAIACPNADLRHLTREQLVTLHHEHGQWREVARVLGIHRSSLQNARRRFGLI